MNKEAQVNEIEQAKRDVSIAEAAQRLMENEDFETVFEELFYKDWLLTQGANFHLYDNDTRRRFLEHLSARSIVKTFLYDIIEQGKQAKDFLTTLEKGDD